MAQARTGDRVQIHYVGTLADGSVFDSSDGRPPLECTVGLGEVIAGLDRALVGMQVGAAQTVVIAPEEAYGAHDPNGRQTLPRSVVPQGLAVDLGTVLEMTLPDGREIPVRVVELTDSHVVLDANHPLAGKELTFVVELIAIL